MLNLFKKPFVNPFQANLANISFLKVDNRKHYKKVNDVVLVFLLLTLKK